MPAPWGVVVDLAKRTLALLVHGRKIRLPRLVVRLSDRQRVRETGFTTSRLSPVTTVLLSLKRFYLSANNAILLLCAPTPRADAGSRLILATSRTPGYQKGRGSMLSRRSPRTQSKLQSRRSHKPSARPTSNGTRAPSDERLHAVTQSWRACSRRHSRSVGSRG